MHLPRNAVGRVTPPGADPDPKSRPVGDRAYIQSAFVGRVTPPGADPNHFFWGVTAFGLFPGEAPEKSRFPSVNLCVPRLSRGKSVVKRLFQGTKNPRRNPPGIAFALGEEDLSRVRGIRNDGAEPPSPARPSPTGSSSPAPESRPESAGRPGCPRFRHRPRPIKKSALKPD